MIKEILLCKYGEIVLKGANRKYFEDMLTKEMKKRAKAYGSFDVYRAQSTIYIEPKDDMADVDGMFVAASKVFGTSVPREDCEEIEAFLKTYGISKVDLIYAGYEALKESVQK